MPTFPLPTNPVRVTWPDVIAAVQAFLNKYTGVQIDHVICGNYNRAALPNTDEIVLYYPLRYERHGTNIETFDAAAVAQGQDGSLKNSTLVEVVFQVDCYSANGVNAMQRAQAVETIARSSGGVQFFNQYNISCLYATDIRDLTATMDAEQYVWRFMTELHLSFWTTVEQGLPWFEATSLELKNVDVVFPPLD